MPKCHRVRTSTSNYQSVSFGGHFFSDQTHASFGKKSAPHKRGDRNGSFHPACVGARRPDRVTARRQQRQRRRTHRATAAPTRPRLPSPRAHLPNPSFRYPLTRWAHLMTLRRAGARRTGNAFEKEQIYREPPPHYTEVSHRANCHVPPQGQEPPRRQLRVVGRTVSRKYSGL